MHFLGFLSAPTRHSGANKKYASKIQYFTSKIPCLDAVGWKTRLGVGFLKMNNKITRKAWRGERETRGEGKGLVYLHAVQLGADEWIRTLEKRCRRK